jgi:2,3-bisphosphoglycerate-dependent phosphoglycerate mutase
VDKVVLLRHGESTGNMEIPLRERLKDTVVCFRPCCPEAIDPSVKSGLKVIVAALGNSLRALVKPLDHVSDDDGVELDIPPGVRLVYELDANFRPVKHYDRGDPKEVRKGEQAVV